MDDMPTALVTNTKVLCRMLMQGWSPVASSGSNIVEYTLASLESVVFECTNDVSGQPYKVTILDTKTLITQTGKPLVTAYFLCLPPDYTQDQNELQKYSFANLSQSSVNATVKLNSSAFDASVKSFVETANKLSNVLKIFETDFRSNITLSDSKVQNRRQLNFNSQNDDENEMENLMNKYFGRSRSSSEASSVITNNRSRASSEASVQNMFNDLLQNINVAENQSNLENLEFLYSEAEKIINNNPDLAIPKLQQKKNLAAFLLQKQSLSSKEALGLYDVYDNLVTLPIFENTISLLLQNASDVESDDELPQKTTTPAKAPTTTASLPAASLPAASPKAPQQNESVLASIRKFDPKNLKSADLNNPPTASPNASQASTQNLQNNLLSQNKLLAQIKQKAESRFLDLDESGNFAATNARKSTMLSTQLRGTSEQKNIVQNVMRIAESNPVLEVELQRLKANEDIEQIASQTQKDLIKLQNELVNLNLIKFFDKNYRTETQQLLQRVQKLAAFLQKYNDASKYTEIKDIIKNLTVTLNNAQRRSALQVEDYSSSDSDDESFTSEPDLSQSRPTTDNRNKASKPTPSTGPTMVDWPQNKPVNLTSEHKAVPTRNLLKFFGKQNQGASTQNKANQKQIQQLGGEVSEEAKTSNLEAIRGFNLSQLRRSRQATRGTADQGTPATDNAQTQNPADQRTPDTAETLGYEEDWETELRPNIQFMHVYDALEF